jgi:hypothetical protein
MGQSENRIRVVQMGPRPGAAPVARPPMERGLPFPATGGGPGGYVTVYPTGHPEGISGPDFLAEIQEDERRRPLGRERRLTPEREFSGREEFEARGRAAQMGPSLPPGAVAGPGAEEQITDAQVVQFLSRMPYRNAGRGPGEALEGVRVQDPRQMPREEQPAREKTPPTVKATRPDPETDRFGEAKPPMDRALAAENADRDRTRGQMGEAIGARRRGEDAAKAKGFKDQSHQQDKGIPQNILRRQWAEEKQARFGGSVEAYYDLYDKYRVDGEGNLRDHRGTQRALAEAGALDKTRSIKNEKLDPVPLKDRQHAAKVRSNQMDRARRLGIPLEDVQISDGYAGAKTPFDIARMGMAAESLRPGRGHGNVAVAIGVEDANAQAVQGLGEGRKTPMEKLTGDQQIADNAPIGERAQAYRLQHQALNAGQPHNPQAENLHIVNAGAQSASAAAASVLSGKAGEDEMAFLKDYTLAFTSGGESTNRASFNRWARRLGIPVTEESMALWFKLTGTNPRQYNEAVGDTFNGSLSGLPFGLGAVADYMFPNVPSQDE